MKIVEEKELTGWAQSCLRSKEGGVVCGKCWKCFRKNSLLGHPITMSNEIESFLKKKPLKQAISTIYSIQQSVQRGHGKKVIESFPDLLEMMDINLSWLKRFHPASLELIPMKYREYTTKRLSEYADAMTESDITEMRNLILYPDSEN
jgi:hypothetical protein